jgi:hypothetical protein
MTDPNQRMQRSTDLFDDTDGTRLVEDRLAMRIRTCMRDMLEGGFGTALIDPIDTARQVASDLGCEWRDLMRPLRHIIAGMARSGELEVLQDGVPVDIGEVRGPIRLRLKRPNLT